MLYRLRYTLFLWVVVVVYLYYPTHGTQTATLPFAIQGTLYLTLLALLARCCLHLENEPPHIPVATPTKFRWGLLIAGIAFLAGQLFFLTEPLLSGPDEPIHAQHQFRQWMYLTKVKYAAVLWGLLCLAIGALATLLAAFTPKRRWPFWLYGLAAMATLLGLFAALYGLDKTGDLFNTFYGRDIRWPPLGTVARQATLTIFGPQELGFRLLSALFAVGTAAVVFKTLQDEGSRVIGVVGASICLLVPLFFEYAHYDYREAGGAFFTAGVILFLARYWRHQRLGDLSLAAGFVAMGYLERRPVLIVACVMALPVVLQLVCRLRRQPGSRALVRLLVSNSVVGLLLLATVYPWMDLSSDVRPYIFHPSNFTDLDKLLAYPKLFVSVLSVPVAIAFVIGAVFSVKRRKPSGLISLGVVFVFYILFTGDDPKWLPQPRFAVLSIPAIAIVSVQAFFVLRGRARGLAIVVILVGPSLGLVAWISDNPQVAFLGGSEKTQRDAPTYPFDDLARDLRERGKYQPRIYYPGYWQTSLRIYHRTIVKQPYHLKQGDRQALPLSLDQVRNECREFDCDYVIFPIGINDQRPTRMEWIEAISLEDLQEGNVSGFDVFGIYERRQFTIGVLSPKQRRSDNQDED